MCAHISKSLRNVACVCVCFGRNNVWLLKLKGANGLEHLGERNIS